MMNIWSRYRVVSLNVSIRSDIFDFWRYDIKSQSLQYRNKLAISGAQLVTLGIGIC